MNASVHVNRLLAEAVWNSFRKKKYGLRNCGAGKNDIVTFFELKNLQKSQFERVSLGVLETIGCGIERLEEKINTL
jgi:hypothetical protein